MKFKITDPANPGQELEIEIPDDQITAAGLIQEPQVNERINKRVGELFAAELPRRVETAVANAKKALLGDAEFRTSALEAWKITPAKPGDDKPGELTPEQVERLKSEFILKEVKPLQEKLDTSNGRMKTLLQQVLHGTIMQAAREHGVKDELLKKGPGKVPAIVAMMEELFGFAEDHNSHLVKGEGDTWKVSTKSGDDRAHPWMTPDEYIADWAGNKDNVWAIDAKRQMGPGVKLPGGGDVQQGGRIVLTPEQASDHKTYQAAKEKADKAGATVFVDDGTN